MARVQRLILPLGVAAGAALLLFLIFSGDKATREGPEPGPVATPDKATGLDKPQISLPATTLSADEVRALFLGRTIESRTLVKKRGSLTYYRPDGEVRQLRDGTTRLGRWRVNRKGRICLRMEALREKCRIIVREPDGGYRKYIVRKNGQHQPTVDYVRFWEGNRFNI